LKEKGCTGGLGHPVYTGCPILKVPPSAFQDQRLKENDSHKSCREQRRLSNIDLGFDIKGHFQGHLKVNFRFLNGTPYFLLHILVAYLDSFPKHYNKVFFHLVLFEL